MNSFDKENFDVSQIFLAYLTFLGNSTKVGIALGVQPEIVEVLAAKEDWAAKLKTYAGLRHGNELSATERAIRRTVAHIQACHLRDIIHRVVARLYNVADEQSLVQGMSPRDPKTNRPRFNTQILCDLTNALYIVTRIITRSSDHESTESAEDPNDASDHRSFAEAIERALSAIDRLPGQDSVALGKASLATWGRDSHSTPQEPV